MQRKDLEGEEGPANWEGNEGSRLSAGEHWEHYGVYPYLLAKLIFWTLVISGLLWALVQISAVAIPLFFSVLIAYILNPTVGRLEKKGVPRSLGILIILTGLIAFATVFAIFLYPTIATQVERISVRAPEALGVLETRTLPWAAERFGLELPETMADAMEQYGEEIRDAFPALAEQVGTWVSNALSRAGTWVVSLVNVILIPFFTFYFLRDFEKSKRRLMQFIPPRKEAVLMDRIRKMDLTVGQWFRGQVQVSVILAVLYAIGLGLVYGLTGHNIQSGVVIGLLTGFLNVIPYVGFAVGSLLAFLVVLIEWTGWGALIGVVVAFTVIQTAESYYITPRVVGDKVGLAPVTVIIVLLIGGQVAGLVGVLLAIPVAGAIKVLIPDMIARYQRSAMYSGVFSYPVMASAVVEEGCEPPRGEVRGEVKEELEREEGLELEGLIPRVEEKSGADEEEKSEGSEEEEGNDEKEGEDGKAEEGGDDESERDGRS